MSTTAGVDYGEAATRDGFDQAFERTADQSPLEPIVTLMPLCDFD